METSIRFAALALALAGGPAAAVEIYSNDFQTAVGAEWSTSFAGGLAIDNAPIPTDGSRRFLGRSDGDSTGGLSNDTATLLLENIGQHRGIELDVELYTLRTWDGNSPTLGPDFWKFNVAGIGDLLNATFGGTFQSYPVPAGSPTQFPGRFLATEKNTMGYTPGGDAVYRMTFRFEHTASELVASFSAANLQAIGDESWGIDNIRVRAVPEPGIALLLTGGLGALVASRRRAIAA